MSKTPQVVWYKRDLRIVDHAPLFEAALAGPVIALYIFEPEYWRLPDTSFRHFYFIHDSLSELQEDLRQNGCSLHFRIGSVIEVLEALKQEIGVFHLRSHEETGNDWTYKRDQQVQAWCHEHGISWSEYPSHGVVRRLKTRDTWAQLREKRMQQPIIPIPQRIECYQLSQISNLPGKDTFSFEIPEGARVQAGGRGEALKTLTSFLDKRGMQYMKNISKPGVSARHCSRLSAHIAYGTVSVREVVQQTEAKLANLDTQDKNESYLAFNLKAFLSRVAWRCHFVQKLEQQPEIEFRCIHPAFEGMRENSLCEDFFEAWKSGHTGYPLVDAAMRSLHQNGWITFRMRAMLVSFASYLLWLDWRQTAPFMAKLFTDYEPGIHYSQFQMQSGVTGMNAIRIYNAIKQSTDHDPEGEFIRRFVPELKNVPTPWVHQPWLMPTIEQKDLGLMIGKDYPKPIIHFESAYKQARSRIADYMKTEGFKDIAKQTYQKLGSRMKRLTRRNTPSKQMTFDFEKE